MCAAYQGFRYLFGHSSFSRAKEGWRFRFQGMKLNSAPDSLPPGKYPIAVNVRAVGDNSVETRPGTGLPKFTTHGTPVTDLRSFTVLGTDNLPRTLARESDDTIWLDNSTQVGTLAAGGPGATMIPFRPNQSPNPYMYIANGADYQKFSAPNPTVVASKTGIAEPQTPCEAAQVAQQFTEILSPSGTWVTGGTGSAWTSSSRSFDIVAASFSDPVNPIPESGHGFSPPRWFIQVGTAVQYQRGEVVYFNGTPALITVVEEVIPPLAISMNVQAIYFPGGGPNGRAVIVLQGVTSPGKTKLSQQQSGIILNNTDVIAQLVRGAIIQVGTETTFVLSVTSGPDNQICIECFLNNTGHVAGETVLGLPTIIVNGVQNTASVMIGTQIVGDQGNVETFDVTTGVGTLTTGNASGGPTGTVLQTPIVGLNGWGPNAHVGITPHDTFGLDPDTTQPYTNPNNVSDGNPNTFAFATGDNTNLPRNGCVWTFTTPGLAPSACTLNILSQIPVTTMGGHAVGGGEAALFYTIDNGVSWRQVYWSSVPRTKQWDRIPLAAGQDLTHVAVMANMYPHNHFEQEIYEINITQGAASIGVNTGVFQQDDYLHFSVLADAMQNVNEIKLQFDVSDGTFLSNYYYYSVRPSDLVPVTQNTVTQLGAIQAIISETITNSSGQDVGLSQSSPSVAGASQWTEVWIPISELTRIGGDPTLTLANINSVQVLVNASGTVNVSISSIIFIGGSQPDVGDIGEPYRYRVRPRSSITGAIGNPTPDMRYGVLAERQPVKIVLPSASYDSQIDTWDVFRFGGSVTEWRFIGSIASSQAAFQDEYSDDAALAGQSLDFDNFEPWPSVDVPFTGTASTICGFLAVVTPTSSATNVPRFLPGNLVNLGGQNAYTLRKRPTLAIGSTTDYLFEFVECTVGFQQGIISDNGNVNIYEPEIARQFLPYMWGPDVNGVVFAVGDPLRAGTLYFSKPSNPDSVPDAYNIELVQPSEPLLGGEVLDGLSFVASTDRWWALYPQLNNPLQRYNAVQKPLPRGLAAPFGHATDGQQIYWWAKDGIWASKEGSLTDEDLYNLFPHEGVPGVATTYGPPPLGRTVQPPDYSRAGKFRLVYDNYFLYAIYQDTTGAYDMLVYDIRRKAWSVDIYPQAISAMYASEQQSGSLSTTPALYSDLLMADIVGNVYSQSYATNDNGTPITPIIATNEFDGGDLRAPKQWGDYFIDALVSTTAGLTVQPMSLGQPVALQTTVPNGASRQRQPLGVGGIVVSDFMGLFIGWTDDFSTQTLPTKLHIWDISFAVQPARTISWTTFGTSFGFSGYGHIREMVMAYVSTADITLTITSFDGQSPNPIILPSTGGQYQKVLFPVSANKGQLFRFQMCSAQTFQIFNEDAEIRTGSWDRQSKYSSAKVFSGDVESAATI